MGLGDRVVESGEKICESGFRCCLARSGLFAASFLCALQMSAVAPFLRFRFRKPDREVRKILKVHLHRMHDSVDDTFTMSDYDTLLSEIFRFWRPPKS